MSCKTVEILEKYGIMLIGRIKFIILLSSNKFDITISYFTKDNHNYLQFTFCIIPKYLSKFMFLHLVAYHTLFKI